MYFNDFVHVVCNGPVILENYEYLLEKKIRESSSIKLVGERLNETTLSNGK